MNTPPMPDSRGPATLQSTTGRIAAVATALLLVLFLVLSVSRAAFVDSTANAGNTAATDGLVTLDNNDNATAMFEATEGDLLPLALDLLPAQVTAALELSAKCINVRYDGDFATDPIRMYATPVDPAVTLGDLAPFLNVTVHMQEVVDGPVVQDAANLCATFNLADVADAGDPKEIYVGKLDGFASNYDDAVDEATFDGEQGTYAFKITVNVENTPAAAQKSAAWNFVWEAQTTDA